MGYIRGALRGRAGHRVKDNEIVPLLGVFTSHLTQQGLRKLVGLPAQGLDDRRRCTLLAWAREVVLHPLTRWQLDMAGFFQPQQQITHDVVGGSISYPFVVTLVPWIDVRLHGPKGEDAVYARRQEPAQQG